MASNTKPSSQDYVQLGQGPWEQERSKVDFALKRIFARLNKAEGRQDSPTIYSDLLMDGNHMLHGPSPQVSPASDEFITKAYADANYGKKSTSTSTTTTPPVKLFTDSMAIAVANQRNQLSPPSDTWLYLVLGGDTPWSSPVGMANYAFGQALSGGGGTGLGISLALGVPGYGLATAIAPVPTYIGSPVYTSPTKFVQYTFNNVSNSQIGIGILSFADLSGTGVAGSNNIVHDCYLVDQLWTPSLGPPRLVRFNASGGPTVLNSGSVNMAQGDVLRVSFDFTNPAQVSIKITHNGVVEYTQVDNNAARVSSQSFPIISAFALANAAAGGFKNFSCGVGL